MPAKSTLKFLALVAALAMLWPVSRFFHLNVGQAEFFFKKFPLHISGMIFVGLYVVVTFFFWFSKDIFKLVSAFLFGAYVSTLFIFIAETINAVILFSLSRSLGRPFIEEHAGKRFSSLDKKLAHQGFPWLFLFRCVPLIPFRFFDLAAGMTGISFKKYMAVVVFGSPVRIFWVQYVLSGAGRGIMENPQAMAEYLSLNKAAFLLTFIYLILMFFVAIKLKKG